MAPENEARPQAAFYDHESEEPRRRRRPAADWGVGEDIFDRMPGRFAITSPSAAWNQRPRKRSSRRWGPKRRGGRVGAC